MAGDRRKAPHSVAVLERWITIAEGTTGVAVARQRRWVSFMVLAAMLEGVVDDADQPQFLVKGGVAMELRFGTAARATKDLDLAFRGASAAEMVDRLDDALEAGHGEFSASRTRVEPVRDTGAQRLAVKLAYRDRPWATVATELAPVEEPIAAEIEELRAMPLDHLGLDGPSDIPCLAVRWQLAQKLHACTEPPRPGGPAQRPVPRRHRHPHAVGSRRPRRQARGARRLHQDLHRPRHPWPPPFDPPAHWAAGYRALAEEIRFPQPDLDDAAAALSQVVAQLQ